MLEKYFEALERERQRTADQQKDMERRLGEVISGERQTDPYAGMSFWAAREAWRARQRYWRLRFLRGQS